MPHPIGTGGRIKHDKTTNYSILLIYCKTNTALKFLDFTTTTNLRNYRYVCMKKRVLDTKFSNLVLFKTINENGGLTNWSIETLEKLESNNRETQTRMKELALKYGIKTNIYDDCTFDCIKNELQTLETVEIPIQTLETLETVEIPIKTQKDVLFECECGSNFKKHNLRSHLKTVKHKQFVATLETSDTTITSDTTTLETTITSDTTTSDTTTSDTTTLETTTLETQK
jgi:hypothetical protein